jgi:hypothetical protein
MIRGKDLIFSMHRGFLFSHDLRLPEYGFLTSVLLNEIPGGLHRFKELYLVSGLCQRGTLANPFSPYSGKTIDYKLNGVIILVAVKRFVFGLIVGINLINSRHPIF